MDTGDILRHCECGICGHMHESDCIKRTCDCCYNFHVRARKDYNSVKTEIIEDKQRFQYKNRH